VGASRHAHRHALELFTLSSAQTGAAELRERKRERERELTDALALAAGQDVVPLVVQTVEAGGGGGHELGHPRRIQALQHSLIVAAVEPQASWVRHLPRAACSVPHHPDRSQRSSGRG